MRIFPAIAAAGLALLPASPAFAAAAVVGSNAAAVCYRNALQSVTTSAALNECDEAFKTELSIEDRIATHVNRGIVHMLRQEDKRAESDFQRAIKMNPRHAEAVLNLALLRLRQGNGEEALTYAQQALDFKTDRPALALYTRGIANEYTGKLKAAYSDLQAAQAADPSWALPSEELKRYQMIKKD